MKTIQFKHPPMKKGSKFTHWIRPVMTGYHLSCCDCGLVHTINFQAIQITKRMKAPLHKYIELNKKDYQVEMKIRRNEKLTKQERKK